MGWRLLRRLKLMPGEHRSNKKFEIEEADLVGRCWVVEERWSGSEKRTLMGSEVDVEVEEALV